MKRVLFIASHRPGRAPGQRFRFEMFFDELEKAGMQCELSYLLDANDDAVFYQKGHYLKKIGIALKSYRKRIADVKRIQEFDLVVLFREALMTRSTFFEKAVSKAGIPMIFDFDDAIWIRDVSQANRAIAWMKNPDKIKTIHCVQGLQPEMNTWPPLLDNTIRTCTSFHQPSMKHFTIH